MKFSLFKAKAQKALTPSFSYSTTDRGVSVICTRGGRKVPPTEWASLSSEAASVVSDVIGRLVQLDDGNTQTEQDENALHIPWDVLAQLSLPSAAAVNLPPPTPLAINLQPIDRIDEDSFYVKLSWIRLGGQPVRATMQGALLKADGSTWRIPEPIWSLYKAVLPLQHPLSKAERFAALAALNKVCEADFGGQMQSEPYLQDLRVHYASAFSLKLRTLKPDLTEFDPVLFGALEARRALEDGSELDEDWDSILAPKSQKLFAEDRFRRETGARPVYVLRDGEYVFIDPSLRPVLNVVRKLQDSAESERRAFILNPRAKLRENLQGEVFADLALEELFIETEQFSQRVSGVDVWRALVLPWIMPSSKNRWLPEKFGLKVDEDYYEIAPEKVAVLVERAEAAHAQAQAQLDVAGLLEAVRDGQIPPSVLPLNSQSLAAIDSLKPFSNRQAAPEVNDAPGQGSDLTYSEKLFLVVRENFEEVEFQALSEERADASNVPVELPKLLKTTLKGHQIDGFEWLARSHERQKKGVLLADDMGLGKTLQAITFMAFLKERMERGRLAPTPMLIVAPTGLLGNWRDEISKHLHEPYLGRLVCAFGGDLKRLKEESGLSARDVETGRASLNSDLWQEAGIVLTTYETLRDYHFSFARARFALIIYDEIQKLKNPTSQLTRAAKTLNGDFVLGMTGTPVENRLQDLWSIMDIIAPGLLGASRDFEKRYPNDNLEKLSDLKNLLTAGGERALPYMLRRLKSDALKGMPLKTVQVYRTAMPEIQAHAYAALVSQAAAGAASGALGRGGMLKVLAGMRGVSLHPVDPSHAPSDLEAYARDSARLGKTLDILSDIRGRDEKALVFVEDLAMQDRLAGLIQSHFKLATTPMKINGTVPGPRRQEMVQRFQTAQNQFVMILSPRAGGVGLTLTAANHVIHLSRWWNPAVEDQATDRVFRIGQTRDVFVHLPLAEHPHPAIKDTSFDVQLNALLDRKRKLTNDLFLPPEASDSDLDLLFNALTKGAVDTAADTAEDKVPDPSAEGARKVLSLPSEVFTARPRIWRTAAGKPSPINDVTEIFRDRTITSVVIKDPYCLCSDGSRSAQVSFLQRLNTAAKSVETVTIEYAAERCDDDAYARRKLGEIFAAQIPGGRPTLTLKRRLRRSRDDDFHDRIVELTVVHAGGAQRVHQLIIGRGLEAFFNDNYECTVAYAPPDVV